MSPARHASDDQLDAATWCRHLIPERSVYAFLADHRVRPLVRAYGGLDPGQVWCRGDRAFAYPVRPADPSPNRPGTS
jgi:hypothetical protein